MSREDCNNDPNVACSTGLHIKSKSYGLNFGNTVIVCLISPYDITAVPKNEESKFRTCAYFPIGLAEQDENGLIEWDETTYDLTKLEGYLVLKNQKHMENYKEELTDVYNDNYDYEKIKTILSKRIISVNNG